jgi:hypothetical protein
MLARGCQPGGNQERADFVAVKSGGVRLVVEARTADVECRERSRRPSCSA